MPHLRFRSVKEDVIKKLSLEISQELAQIVNTSEDNFTYEAIASSFFEKGNKIPSYPFVEVHWFPRSAETKKNVALFLDQKIKKATNEKDVIIVFYDLDKSSYFENGVSF